MLAMPITVSIIRMSARYIQIKKGEFFQNYYVTNLDSNPLLLFSKCGYTIANSIGRKDN